MFEKRKVLAMTNYLTNEKNLANSLKSDAPMFPISIVADILKVHQRTLRIYDDENILVPSRSAKNRRLYSLDDIEKGKFVQYLSRELGINLAGIKIIFHILTQQKLETSKFLDHIAEIARELEISSENHEENKAKFSKKWRKSEKAEEEKAEEGNTEE